MPRTKQQYEEMREQTRAKIESAAMALFVRQGYGSTNVQQIADSAGISVGLLYRHYKTKDDLFQHLVSFAASGLERLAESFRTSDSPRQRLTQFAEEIVQDMNTGDTFAHFMLLMAQPFLSREDGAEQSELRRKNRELLEATTELIAKGQRMGEMRNGDACEKAVYFYAAIQGLAMMKAALKDQFVMPSPMVLMAVLDKEASGE